MSQLALGTLQLEGTANAVLEDQAARLLPLWQAWQSSTLQSNTERNALTKQIETSMTEAQVSAIAAMRLTEEDVQTWAQSQGARPAPGDNQPQGGRQRGGSTPQGGSEGQDTPSREQVQAPGGVSPEERATRRAQFGAQGRIGGTSPSIGGGTSVGLARAVVALLVERSGQTARPRAAQTPAATSTPLPLRTRPDSTTSAEPTLTAEPTATPTPVPTSRGAAEPTATPTPTMTTAPSSSQAVVPTGTPVPAPSALPALEQIPDTDPGPPFTIEVSANYALQDPLVEKSRTYVITGIVRNDGDETYAVSDIQITFYDASGFRGTFTPAIRDGILVGGEWHWHGETELDFAALLLAPGEEWPYAIAITAQDMASFLIHPDAAPTGRESAPVELSDLRLADDTTGYMRITGTATNRNPFAVKNVTVSGTLIDRAGQIVSVGSTYVLEENIAPGASVRFDLRIEEKPFTDYQLYAQSERGWE